MGAQKQLNVPLQADADLNAHSDNHFLNPNVQRVCIFLGMAGLFSALIRTPLTAVFVVYDMTGLGAQGMELHVNACLCLTSLTAFLFAEYLEHADFASVMMFEDRVVQ
jgi:H+/Cl- antiporter ClcA